MEQPSKVPTEHTYSEIPSETSSITDTPIGQQGTEKFPKNIFLATALIFLLVVLLIAYIAFQKSNSYSVALTPNSTESQNQEPKLPESLTNLSQKTKTAISKLAEIESSVYVKESEMQKQPVFPVIDTNQHYCFSESEVIPCGGSFTGQDAEYEGFSPNYQDNGDGTITDRNTGLMWIKDPGEKMTYTEALSKLNDFSYADYSDWRAPTIKELYSLIDFSGQDISESATESTSQPFINTTVFVFEYGNLNAGDRIIDSQWVSTSLYVAKVMNNQSCFFGVNFADGRIKCYPTGNSSKQKTYYARYVRGTTGYGRNNFFENNDGTVIDTSSSLMWQQSDSGRAMDWKSALSYCKSLSLAGKSDWRLPNAKELQYIVEYTRSPDTTNSPAIDPIFSTTPIINEMGQIDYPFYWTSTTHENQLGPDSAVYISFGRCLGAMNGELMDVHGAGCQRSDPKTGDPNNYPQWGGKAPQGDVQRVFNFVRCVRGGEAKPSAGTNPAFHHGYTQPPAPLNTQDQSLTAPTEAMSACSQKQSGASCSFGTPNGIITGSCQKTPNGTTACVPN